MTSLPLFITFSGVSVATAVYLGLRHRNKYRVSNDVVSDLHHNKGHNNDKESANRKIRVIHRFKPPFTYVGNLLKRPNNRNNNIQDPLSIKKVRKKRKCYVPSDKILNKIEYDMEHGMRYKEPDFNLEQYAYDIGTNRTYLSAAINKKFKKRFTQYVNEYRLREAARVISKYPCLKREEVALMSGFNSVNTFVRVLKMITGYCFSKWRNLLLSEDPDQ